MNSYGFIITRHVNSELTNKYWNNCVKQLRFFYPFRKIVIIDDNSNPQFLKADQEYENVTTINSEFKGRGELLPYYYYSKNKFFDNAIIIHDSVFFHKRVNFEILILQNISVLPLWYFHADKENLENTLRISNVLNNKWEIQKKITLNDVVLGMKHLKWYGCFGCQSFINRNFLLAIESKYNISKMIHTVQKRKDRCCLERILGAIFFTEYQSQKNIGRKSLLGDIMKYQKWGYSYNDYQVDLKKGTIAKGVIKIWTGR
jgi:hypothetical protein